MDSQRVVFPYQLIAHAGMALVRVRAGSLVCCVSLQVGVVNVQQIAELKRYAL